MSDLRNQLERLGERAKVASDAFERLERARRRRERHRRITAGTVALLVAIGGSVAAFSAFRGSGEKLHVTERFTRVDADTIRYEFTADDPTTWTRSWSAEIPMRRMQGPLYEYACTEGNYGLENILRGGRVDDAKAEAAAKGVR